MQITLKVNGQARSIDADPDMPLLWALRDFLGLKAPSTAAASVPAAPARCR